MAILVIAFDSSTGFRQGQLVGSSLIADNALTSSKVASGSIAGVHIANQSLISANFGSGQIASAHIASSFIGNLTLTLTSGQVQSGIIGNNAVNSGNVASGSINGIHVANASITSSDIASGLAWHMEASRTSATPFFSAAWKTKFGTTPAVNISIQAASGQPNARLSSLPMLLNLTTALCNGYAMVSSVVSIIAMDIM